MQKTIIACATSLLLASTLSIAEQKDLPHWEYEGAAGPEHWSELSPEYHTCHDGKNQSPIDISYAFDADLPAIEFNYTMPAREILNNGHTVQVNMSPGSYIKLDGVDFEFKQFHFHAPSENHINGKEYAMEMHFVHVDRDGNLAVVGILFEEGAENPRLAKLWPYLPQNAGEKVTLPPTVDKLMNTTSKNKDYFRFSGSLTTPPCTEGVRWIMLKQMQTVSKEQVADFLKAVKHKDNRPIQSLNGRVIVQ